MVEVIQHRRTGHRCPIGSKECYRSRAAAFGKSGDNLIAADTFTTGGGHTQRPCHESNTASGVDIEVRERVAIYVVSCRRCMAPGQISMRAAAGHGVSNALKIVAGYRQRSARQRERSANARQRPRVGGSECDEPTAAVAKLVAIDIKSGCYSTTAGYPSKRTDRSCLGMAPDNVAVDIQRGWRRCI